MTMWIAVLLACGACFALKFVGYLVPESWVAGERTSRVTTLIPVALLAGLVVVQTVVGAGGALALDARLVAVAIAVVLLLARANFVVVVLVAALVAAGLRALGWG
jgi:branched-subunit amino acid transport protein